MEDLSRLKARQTSLRDLGELFSAMQAMAASRVQASVSALAGIRRYTEVIEQAITDAVAMQTPMHRLRDDAPEPEAPALLVVCSEQGFAGSLNRQLIERALRERAACDQTMVIGRRGVTLAAEMGLPVSWSGPMATRVEGVTRVARSVASRLRDANSVRVIFAHYTGASQFEPQTLGVLPPSPRLLKSTPRGGVPLHQLPPATLLRGLLDELLMAELSRTIMESFASENAARLQIMQSANHNIGDKLDKLATQIRSITQDAITSELIEVVTGSEAVLDA